MCVFTVSSETYSDAAISRLESSPASSRRTAISRSVSSSRCAALLEQPAREMPDHRHEVLAEPARVAQADRPACEPLRRVQVAEVCTREREVAERVALPEVV